MSIVILTALACSTPKAPISPEIAAVLETLPFEEELPIAGAVADADWVGRKSEVTYGNVRAWNLKSPDLSIKSVTCEDCDALPFQVDVIAAARVANLASAAHALPPAYLQLQQNYLRRMDRVHAYLDPLSTGYRLATLSEWKHMAGPRLEVDDVPTFAHVKQGIDRTTRPVCTKKRTGNGFCDAWGNALDWTADPVSLAASNLQFGQGVGLVGGSSQFDAARVARWSPLGSPGDLGSPRLVRPTRCEAASRLLAQARRAPMEEQWLAERAAQLESFAEQAAPTTKDALDQRLVELKGLRATVFSPMAVPSTSVPAVGDCDGRTFAAHEHYPASIKTLLKRYSKINLELRGLYKAVSPTP